MQGSPSDCPARAQEGRRLREQHERLWNCRRNGKRGQILQKKSSRWSKICFFKKSRLSIPGSKDGVPHLLQPCQGAGEVLHLWTRQGSGYFQVNVFIINCQHTDSPSLLCWLVLTFNNTKPTTWPPDHLTTWPPDYLTTWSGTSPRKSLNTGTGSCSTPRRATPEELLPTSSGFFQKIFSSMPLKD